MYHGFKYCSSFFYATHIDIIP